MKTQKILSLILIILFFFLGINNIYSQDFWEPTNGPYGGTVLSFVINSNGHIFAGTRDGVFRSTDNGESWTQTGLTEEYVKSLAINASGHLFAGGDSDVFRSTNNGDSWEATGCHADFWGKSIVINSSGHIFAGTTEGVFRSTDNGDNWTQINTGLSKTYVRALAINKANGYLYVGTQDYGGISYSADNGDNWTSIGLTYQDVLSIVVNSSGHIFAGTFDAVFSSTNNGDSWIHIKTGLEESYSGIQALAVNSLDQVYAGGWDAGVLRLNEDSESWTQINTDLTTTLVNSIFINSSDHLYAGTEGGGAFVSVDNGDSWTQINKGMSHPMIYSLVTNSSGHIFAGTDGSGIYRSVDNGNTWAQTESFSLKNFPINTLAINKLNGHIFSGTTIGAFRSTDNGDTWTSINNGLKDEWGWSIEVVAFAINSNDNIFAGTYRDGVFRSTDNGNNWTQTGFMDSTVFVNSLAINKNSGDIFVGTWEGIYLSTDNGDNWTKSDDGLTKTIVWGLAINPSGHIFAATDDNGLIHSTNNGDSWTQTGMAYIFGFQDLIINSNGHIFIADIFDVLLSTDNGDTWEEINSGMPELISARSFAFSSNGRLFAGTNNGGVFRSKESTVTVKSIKASTLASFSLEQNYPNPFNPTTTIQFSLPHTSFVTLKVFNILGEEVSTLVAERLAGGKYNVEWNGNGFVSGVYYYRLKTEQFVETKKLILLK